MELAFYYHPESGSPFATYDPPEVVLDGPDGGLCYPISEERFYELCAEHDVVPEIPPRPVDHCAETRLRIRLAVAAWAYEVHNDPLMSDEVFDQLALRVDVRKSTARPDLDAYFRKHFSPHTGMWVLNHPEKDALEATYRLMRPTPITAPMSRWEALLRRIVGSGR